MTAKPRKRLSAVISSSTKGEDGNGRELVLLRSRRRRSGAEQPVAKPRHGDDPFLPVLARAERLAERGHLYGKVGFIHRQAGPGGAQQGVLADWSASRLHQCDEERDRPLADGQRLAFAMQRVRCCVDAEWAKPKLSCLHAVLIAFLAKASKSDTAAATCKVRFAP